jgi:hypothetical protein
VNVDSESAPDFDALRQQILGLHEAEIEAHWNKDVDFFGRGLSEKYISVGSGEISAPTAEETVERFSNYLGPTTFSEYRDLREPIVSFSQDGSMAWAVFQVKVAGKRALDDGTQRDVDFTCAWMTVYQRQGDGWMRLADASTFK